MGRLKKIVSKISLFLLASAVATPLFAADSIRLWPVGICDKIFADSAPGEFAPISANAARNEYESAQFGVFSEKGVENVVLSVSDLTNVDDPNAKISAENVRLRPIDSLPITKNTPGADKIVVRKAPCEIPDILREETTITLNPGEARGIWTTIFVPADAAPGKYAATISVRAGSENAEIPLELEVFRFELPSERHLWATNWFNLDNFAKVHNVEIWSEEYWTILEKYFKNMAEHRQNVVLVRWIPDGKFVRATRAKDGTWSVDRSNLERYLALAEKCGVGERFEFSHIGGIDREKHVVRFSQATVFDENEGKNVAVGVDDWLEPVLSSLEKFLIETNRIDRATIHVADEPYQPDMRAWREASERLHKIAPKIKRIDAIESLHFSDDLEVWVPKLSHFDRWRNEFARLRADAAQNAAKNGSDVEFWYYICCHPFGERYPNRFIDLPASRVRSLHWINYVENLTGYLHWGYNFWGENPFGAPTEQYGPGDTHVVYPGPLDSVRWEIERESLEDYEYFVLLQNLTEKTIEAAQTATDGALWQFADPDFRAKELARRAVRSAADVELDPKIFEETRLETAREIESALDGPRLLVRTFPEDGATLIPGPTVVEIYGWTEPGASVAVDGRPIEVRENGTFEFSDFKSAEHSLEITATKGERTSKTTRNFFAPTAEK